MKLSVCIPTYNHGRYIAQAIDSVLMQRVDFDYEILIGEDDSSDGTREIVKQYKDKHPDKIRLFLNDRKNVMYIDGRPTGRWNVVNLWKRSKGKYIALLDGDDYWTNADKLQKQMDFLDNHSECSICFHNAKIIYEDVNRRPRDFCPPNQKPIIYLEDLLEKNMIPSASVIFRRGLFGEFPDWYFKLSFGDWPIHILNAQYGSAGYLNEVMSVYRIYQKSMSRDRIKMTLSKIQMYNYLNKHFKYKYENILKRWKMFYKAELRAEYYKDALHSIFEAAKLDPGDMNVWQVINRILLEGEWMFKMGDRARAFSVLTEIVNMRPDYSLAYVNLGILYFLDGEKSKAIKNFDNAMEIYRKAANDCIERESKVRGLLILEKYYRRIDLQSKAEEVYKEIMHCIKDGNQNVKDYRVLVGLGDLFMARTRYSEAVENYRAVIKFKEKQGEERLGGSYLNPHKHKAAEKTYKEALVIEDISEQDRYHVQFGLGKCYSALKMYPEAEGKYIEILSIDKLLVDNRLSVILELTKCYLDQGKTMEIEYMDTLSNNDISNIGRFRFLNRLGSIYLNCLRMEEARQRFRDALLIEDITDKDRYQALFNLGKCYSRKGEPGKAEKQFDQALTCQDITDASRYSVLSELVDCYFRQGKFHEIEDVCRKVLLLKGISEQQKHSLINQVKQKINVLSHYDGGARV